MTIYQHIVEFNSNDGIGNDIIGLSSYFSKSKLSNKIVTIKNKFVGDSDDIIELETKKIHFNNQDLHILHYGSAGYPINFFLDLPGKKILRFHNITPVIYFQNFCEDSVFSFLEMSYKLSIIELRSLIYDLNEIWYDSDFNRKTLHSFFSFETKNITEKILPIFRDYTKSSKSDFKPNYKLLYIGRIVPHKKIEDLIFILYYLKKISLEYQLTIVGKTTKEFLKYYNYLLKIISELHLENNIIWNFDINETELIRIRNNSGFFISMSEHEGFGIPLLEAFAQSLPVIAYNTTAVGETMRTGGVKIYEKNFAYIAEIIHYININPLLKSKICRKQFLELEYYENISKQSDFI